MGSVIGANQSSLYFLIRDGYALVDLLDNVNKIVGLRFLPEYLQFLIWLLDL